MDTPLILPRAKIDEYNPADARHPLNQPLDEARLEMALGASRQAGIPWRAEEATRHGDASEKVSMAVDKMYAKYRRTKT